MAFGPKADLLVTGGTDCTTRLWKPDTPEPVGTWKDHQWTLYASAFAPSGRLFATACEGGRIVIRDVEREEPVRVIEAKGRLNGLHFSADGKLLYGGGRTGVQVWAVATGERGEDLEGQGEAVRGMGADGSGKLLAATGAGGVAVWNLDDRRLLCTVGAERKDLYTVALHPEGRLLAAGARDGSVRVWDLSTKEVLATVQAHRGHVWGLSFSSDGSTLASGGEDAVVRLWRVRPAPPTGGGDR